jgi:hypothetical protein
MIQIKVIKLNATNTMGARIKATLFLDGNKTFITNTIPYPHELSGSSVFVWGAESMLFAYTMKGNKDNGSLWGYLLNHGIYLCDDEKRTFMIPTKKGYDIVTDIDCNFLDNVNEKKK